MIFLSYAQKDGAAHVERLETALQAAGFETWRDSSGLHPASRIDVTIEDNIKTAESVIVCITPDVRREDSFVRNEIGYALALKKPIIVARFENENPPIRLINHLWIDFFSHPWDDAVRELHYWLKRPREPQKPRIEAAPDDPFRPYLESALRYIVEGLRQRIIMPIDLKARETPDAVSPSTRKTNIFDLAFSGVTMGIEHMPARSFKNFREGFESYEGRALLLGEPGAGKTVTLMAYARDAYAARLNDPSLPLPLFNLVPTWDAEKQTPLHEWIAETHGLDTNIVRQQIDSGRALLLLDGLDELTQERVIRDDDGATIEKYDPRSRFLEIIPPNNRVLLTCRTREYREIGHKAALNGAITLQPLDDDQMRDYLQDQPELGALLEKDEALRQVTRTPLLMSLFAFAYRDLPSSERQQLMALSDARHLRDKIFMRYIEQRYRHEQAKIGAGLPFRLDEVKMILGQLAMDNAVGGREQDEHGEFHEVRENVLIDADFKHPLLADRTEIFTTLMLQLNLLTLGEDGNFRFIHLLLRDALAFSTALPALNDADTYMRLSAAAALRRIGDPRAVDALIRALNDAVPTVRLSAADALRRIGDAHAVDPLIRTLYDPHAAVRWYAAYALEEIGTPEARQAVAKWRENHM